MHAARVRNWGCVTTPRQRPRQTTRAPALVAALALVAAVAGGCGDDDDPLAAPTCSASVREASLAVEVDEQIQLLDLAFSRCPSSELLTAEMSRYPGIVGYSVPTFISLRCTTTSDDAVRTSPVCASIAAPATTPAPASADVVFVAATLDGRQIEIRPDADTAFVGATPEAVQRTVDIAIEAGCDGVIAQRDQWAALVADPVLGDEASAYAKHAENVAVYIGCVFEPIGP